MDGSTLADFHKGEKNRTKKYHCRLSEHVRAETKFFDEIKNQAAGSINE